MNENDLSLIEKLFLKFYCYPPPGRSVSSDMSCDVDLKEDPLHAMKKWYGVQFLQLINDKVVLDVGCGTGEQVVGCAVNGAKRSIGIDIRPLQGEASKWADDIDVGNTIIFTNDPIKSLGKNSIDLAYCLNAFEHFSDPLKVLKEIHYVLKKDGKLLVTFGPPWFAPYGVHMFFMIKYPWAHILFPENTILNVRRLYRRDNAMKYDEVEGGLNQMTLARFKKNVENSNFRFQSLDLAATKNLRCLLGIPYVRELFITQITAVLIKK